MYKIKWAIIIVVSIWGATHPNTQFLMKGLKSSFIEDPFKASKENAREELEQMAREREEAREREINKTLKKMGAY